jgi:hypothetical protein
MGEWGEGITGKPLPVFEYQPSLQVIQQVWKE